MCGWGCSLVVEHLPSMTKPWVLSSATHTHTHTLVCEYVYIYVYVHTPGLFIEMLALRHQNAGGDFCSKCNFEMEHGPTFLFVLELLRSSG
jgi:hypothetical protein